MQVNENNNLEKLVDKMMRETALESPSFDFTSKIMSKVALKKVSQATQYKPLISKTTFVILFGVLVVFYVLLLRYGNWESSSWLDAMRHRSFYPNNFWSGFSISKITVYSIVISMIMFCIQIPFLKNHFNRKFTH
jgi:hypothetical protein